MKKIFSLVLLGMLFSIASSRAQCTIAGPESICVGTTHTYISPDSGCAGGFWTSLNPSIATIGSTSGVLFGVSPGVDTITYFRPGLGLPAIKVITVNPIPTISGPTVVMTGGTITLSGTPPGGTWSSSCPTILTVGTTSGIVTGVGPGSCVVTYSRRGCTAHVTIEDSTGVEIDSITGPSRVCVGNTVTLFNATSGGTWSSSNPAIAAITPGTGIVTGMSAGTVIITYTVGTGFVTFPFAVSPIPVISGPASVCVGNSITLTGTPSGGTWFSSSPTIASITSGGMVTGIGVGVSTISYYIDGCLSTRMVTVTPAPAPISGPATVSVSGTITLTDATPGGTWSTSSASVAIIGSSTGIVTGISPGVCNIYYTVSGCSVVRSLTVTPSSSIAPITGSSSTCVGASTLLSDATPGGTWSSSNTSVATVTSTGLVTGVSAGSVTITYTVGTGFVTKSMTVYSSAIISGPSSLCVGGVITLSGTPSGGSWISGSTTIATVGSATGVVTGVATGVTNIYYLAGGCSASRTVTVSPMPAPISGITSATVGGTSTLTDATAGGTWSSSNTLIATVSTTGVVSGVAAGGCTITYTLPSGCFTTISFTVTTATIPPIGGPSATCVGSAITLTNATPGGTWSSSNTAIATVSGSGVVTGISAGSATITYTVGASFVTKLVTISSGAVISGPATVCVGSTITLSGTPSGGTWTSSAPTVASVSASGVVTGFSVGSVNITYVGGGCTAVRAVSVTPAPAAITGITSIPVGGTSTLSNAVSGGTWSSSNTSIASVNISTGVVTGVAAGTCTITYTLAGGCFRTISFTVTGATTIAPIVGPSGTCVGASVALSDSTPGGTWSSSNPSVATVSSTGMVTGVAAGTCNITYTVGAGFVIKSFTVSTSATITGSSSICIGGTTTLTGTPSGGTWLTSSPSIATVSSSGLVTGIAGGVVNIYYTSGGCSAFRLMTVNTSATITGSSSLCVGTTATMTATPPGGTWSSSNTSIATVSTSGVVSSINPGVVNIYYSTSGCYTYKSVTVNASAVISGSSSVCIGTTISLTATPAGGTWSSSNPSIATISSAGVVSGIATGSVVITYNSGGCSATRTITVVSGASISGGSSTCIGTPLPLTGTPSGGTWTSSSTAIATVTSTGLVTPVSAGTVTIYYNTTSGCAAYHMVTVSASAAISGSSAVCTGSTITLSATPSGGTWTSSNPSLATVNSAGVVTGISSGTLTITYTSGGCTATKLITVTAGATISGSSTLCAGSTITFVATPAGGTWASSNTGIATVSSTGVVNGITAGVVNISYTLSGGCTVVRTVTVNGSAAITGSSTLCIGSSTTLSAVPPGGTWSSSAPSVASVSTSGVVAGMASGTVTIYYVLGGCYASKTMTITASPVISGSATVCIGGTSPLTATPSGGTWTSSSASVATVSGAGVVSGVAAGTATITYSVGSCFATRIVTVTPGSSAITGSSTVCVGSSVSLIGTPSGGTWASGYTGIATVSGSGVVMGVAPGVVTVYYSVGGCYAYKSVSVNPVPSTIVGAGTLCVGASISLSDATPGGTWSSSNTTRATVTSTGLVTGVGAGTVNINYTVGGCSAVKTLTVNPTPAPISGGSTVAVGGILILSDAVSGGTWTSTNPSKATVNPTTGVVTGVSSGTVTINYAIGSCVVSKTITVMIMPFAPAHSSLDAVALGEGPEDRSASKGTAPGSVGSTLIAEAKVSIFPNPTNGNLHIKWENQETGNAAISVADIIGREVYRSTLNVDAASGQVQLELADLKDGIYMIMIKSETLHYSGRLIIRK